MSDPKGTPASRDFASERSHRDYEQSNDAGRSAAQAAILINGGAATAILAYLSKTGLDPVVLQRAPWCLVGYVVGVAAGTAMMFFSHLKLNEYGNRWRVTNEPGNDPGWHQEEAFKWWKVANWCFATAMAAFVLTSVVICVVLAFSHPAAVQH